MTTPQNAYVGYYKPFLSLIALEVHMFIAPPHFSGVYGMHTVHQVTMVTLAGSENLDDFLYKHSHILSLWSEKGEALRQQLNEEQRQAIQRALESNFFLIQGPPG